MKLTDLSKKVTLKPKEVERIYGLKRQWLANQRWLGEGIPYSKVGYTILYRVKDIEDFLNARKIVPVPRRERIKINV